MARLEWNGMKWKELSSSEENCAIHHISLPTGSMAWLTRLHVRFADRMEVGVGEEGITQQFSCLMSKVGSQK